MKARRVRCWPCAKAKRSASAGGTARVATIVSRVSWRTSATVSEWNLLILGSRSVALEVVEGLQARVAAVQRLARRRAELAGDAHVARTAVRACRPAAWQRRPRPSADVGDGDRLLRRQSDRRRDAVVTQLALALLAHPVGGPGRGDAVLQPHARQPVLG